MRQMRVAVELPAFLRTRGEANSPSYALRAALAERLASWQPLRRETALMKTRLRTRPEAETQAMSTTAK
jgi:hypothetical protein